MARNLAVVREQLNLTFNISGRARHANFCNLSSSTKKSSQKKSEQQKKKSLDLAKTPELV